VISALAFPGGHYHILGVPGFALTNLPPGLAWLAAGLLPHPE